MTPHVACNVSRPGGSALDARTTRHAGYRAGRRLRKRIEEGFGWGKDGRPLRKMKVRSKVQVGFMATLAVGAATRCCASPSCLPSRGSCRRSDRVGKNGLISVLGFMNHEPATNQATGTGPLPALEKTMLRAFMTASNLPFQQPARRSALRRQLISSAPSLNPIGLARPGVYRQSSATASIRGISQLTNAADSDCVITTATNTGA